MVWGVGIGCFRADELGKGEIAKVDYLTWVTTKYMGRRYLS